MKNGLVSSAELMEDLLKRLTCNDCDGIINPNETKERRCLCRKNYLHVDAKNNLYEFAVQTEGEKRVEK